jgi:hypothetical protein
MVYNYIIKITIQIKTIINNKKNLKETDKRDINSVPGVMQLLSKKLSDGFVIKYNYNNKILKKIKSFKKIKITFEKYNNKNLISFYYKINKLILY